MKGSPEKILTFLKLSDCLFTVEHGQKINFYNLSHMKYPNPQWSVKSNKPKGLKVAKEVQMEDM